MFKILNFQKLKNETINKKIHQLVMQKITTKNFRININKYGSLTNKKLIKINKFSFVNKSDEHDQTNNQRYHYEYENPQTQDVNKEKLSTKLLKLTCYVILIISISYLSLFRKYSIIGKKYEWYFINEKYEIKLSEYASKFIQRVFENYIFKQDSEEAQQVLKIYKKLLEKNKFNYNPNQKNIFVIDSVSIGAFILKNGDLFISNRILEIANNNENEIAFFISTQISTLLMEKTTSIIFKYIFIKYLGKYLPIDPSGEKIFNLSFVGHRIENLNYFNRFLLFYPESLISTYYEEYEIMRIAIKLLNTAEFNLLQVNFNYFILI
jgi:hypothetical protein